MPRIAHVLSASEMKQELTDMILALFEIVILRGFVMKKYPGGLRVKHDFLNFKGLQSLPGKWVNNTGTVTAKNTTRCPSLQRLGTLLHRRLKARVDDKASVLRAEL